MRKKCRIRKTGVLNSIREKKPSYTENEDYIESKALVDEWFKDREEEKASKGRRWLKIVVYNVLIRLFFYDDVARPISDAEKFCKFVKDSYEEFYEKSFDLGEKVYIQNFGFKYFNNDHDREIYAEMMTVEKIKEALRVTDV